jgi:hypothetical protein
LWFFQTGCFWYNAPGYGFKKLTGVDVIIIFSYFFSVLWFFYVFFYQIILTSWPRSQVRQISLSWLVPYSLNYMIVMLTRINSSMFFLSFLLPNFILSYLMAWELNCIISPYLQKYFFHGLSLSLFFIHLLSLFIFWSSD